MIFGIGSQLIILIMSFIGRSVFIKFLGAEFLGVNGLYNNILTVLSLAELGIGNVMIYSLYKPLSNNDRFTIRVLLNYYKKIYRIVALAVLIIGLLLIPFLNIIVNSDISNSNLILYYVLFLMNSVASYFSVYKAILINADQKIYIVKGLQTAVIIVKEILQIVILLFTKSYILYLFIMIASTILNNIFISVKANNLYPFIKIKEKIRHEEFGKKEIKNNLKSTFLYKIGVVIMNNTDNILISIIIGTVYVGYYSNYSLLVTAITTFIGVLIQALFSSIGNFNADGEMQKSYKLFNVLLLVFHWIAACCSICFLLVFNDFITVWVGDNYILGTNVVIVIVINFYIQNIINPVWMYRETMGLFNEIKYIMLVASLLNLVLSVILGVYWGLSGILVSTAISRIFTVVWYEPNVLFKSKFGRKVSDYWIRQTKYFIITIVTSLLSLILLKDIPISLLGILLKILCGSIFMSSAFLIVNYKKEEFLVLRKYVSLFKNR
ncbi:lipopolysaccharide biosynthesis protein [Paenibacillus silagei]|nr:sugar translocase [Paenibacillus silagei]